MTLDTNCIIALEKNNDPEAPYIKALISLHDDQQINLRVVAISASERKRNGTYASNFAEFKRKIAAVGLGHVDILKPMGRWDVTFWDWCVLGSQEMVELEKKIHRIMFPNIEWDYNEFCTKRGLDPRSGETDPRWRNPMCDVVALWSHIHYGGGIFVTTDTHFHKGTKKPDLIALGAGEILQPEEAVARLTLDAQSK